MYIDGVIVMGLIVVALIIAMMVFVYRYAKRHVALDEKQAQRQNDVDHVSHC